MHRLHGGQQVAPRLPLRAPVRVRELRESDGGLPRVPHQQREVDQGARRVGTHGTTHEGTVVQDMYSTVNKICRNQMQLWVIVKLRLYDKACLIKRNAVGDQISNIIDLKI